METGPGATHNIPIRAGEPGRVTPGRLCRECVHTTQKLKCYLKNRFATSQMADETDLSQARYTIKTTKIIGLRAGQSELCHLCTLLWHSLPTDDVYENEEELQLSISIPADLATTTLLHLRLQSLLIDKESAKDQNTLSGQLAITLEFWDKTASEKVEKTVPSRDSENLSKTGCGTSTGSRTSIDLANYWIRKCTRNHSECSSWARIDQAKALPTRLIDVSSGTQHLRIHRTAEEPAQGWTASKALPRQDNPGFNYDTDYVALSHSWGGGDFTKLTTQSYARMCDEFSMNELPLTWKEAIELTRTLGYRYLWIDALCIIQDSLYDWEVEAASMAQVYENCHLNIAALSGTTSYNGLFQHRDPLAILPCDITDALSGDGWPDSLCLRSAIVAAPEYTARRSPNLHNHHGPLDYVSAMTTEALNRRGWVVQERSFSPRTLYFGTSCLFWDCRRSEFEEFSPALRSKSTSTVNLKKGLPLTRQLQTSGPHEEIFDAWYKLLRLYCASELTFESDRLLAISGLAKQVSEMTGSAYVAGIWQKCRLQDLLWCISEPVDCISNGGNATNGALNSDNTVAFSGQPSNMISFSWASIGGSSDIHWPLRDQMAIEGCQLLYQAQVEGNCLLSRPAAFTSVHWKDDDRFGRVLSATFTFSCMVSDVSPDEEGQASDWAKASETEPKKMLEADIKTPVCPEGLRWFPDRTKTPLRDIFRASLVHLRREDGLVMDFGLLLMSLGTEFRSQKRYKRIGMCYEVYDPVLQYSRNRKGMYRSESIVVL